VFLIFENSDRPTLEKRCFDRHPCRRGFPVGPDSGPPLGGETVRRLVMSDLTLQGYLAHKKTPTLGPYSRPIPRTLLKSWGVGAYSYERGDHVHGLAETMTAHAVGTLLGTSGSLPSLGSPHGEVVIVPDKVFHPRQTSHILALAYRLKVHVLSCSLFARKRNYTPAYRPYSQIRTHNLRTHTEK